ncbi:MAG: hypothetical protein JXB36_10545, partial [Gammaproteobacteria bacterium]|nr:hypothetical protein [Gammaproteobacteria bacterium]
MQTQHSHAAVSGYRLSSQQRRIWRAAAEGFVPSARCLISVDGDVDADALSDSFDDLTRGNPALTAPYRSVPGLEPLQDPATSLEPAWRYVDLGDTPPEERFARVEAIYGAQPVLDLENGPLLHATMLKLAARRHAIVVHVAPLCADAFSLLRLPARLGRLYAARRAGETLPPPAIDYFQFAEWQRELLEDEDAERGRAFWRNRCAGQPAQIALPYSFGRAIGSTLGSAIGSGSGDERPPHEGGLPSGIRDGGGQRMLSSA